MAKKFLTDINIAGGVYDSSGDIGSSGQVLSSTGSSVNWVDNTAASSVIYQDTFTGNGSTTAFTLANSVDDENKLQVYINGVYQFKSTFSLSGTTLTFSSAPPSSTDIEVITLSSITVDGAILTDSEFASAGLMKTNGSGTYSIIADSSTNWNTAYTHSQATHAPSSAEQNVQSDYTASSGDAFILNKPTIPSGNQIIDWTADQGSTNLHAGNYTDTNTTYSVGDGGLTEINFTSADNTKLDAIEASATADQSSAEIVAAVEAGTDSNTFTDADHTKLNAIEAGADVTDTTNVTASGALMDSELTDLAGVKAVDISTLATETYVGTQITALVDSSPAALNTLNELAAALGDDANFSTTVTNSIALKAPLASPTFTGTIIVNGTGIDIDNNDDVRLRFDNASVFKAGLQVATTAGDMIAGSAINDFAIRSQANILFSTGGNVEKMRIDSAGNVGIGTDDPQTNLEISDASGAALTIRSVSATGYSLINFGDTADDNVGRIYYGHDDNAMRFRTNDAERMRIDSAGNIGIGTPTPSYPLVVSNGGASGIEFVPNALTGMSEILTYNRSASAYEKLRMSASAFEWYTSAVSNALVILNNGKVGIGTSSPTELFTVGNATAGTNVSMAINGVASKATRIKFQQAGADKWMIGNGAASEDNKFAIYNGVTGEHAMIVDPVSDNITLASSGGYVGIGTTTMNTTLNLYSASNTQMGFQDAGTGTGSADGFRVGWNGTYGQMWLFENATMRFATNNSVKMTILSGGNVGIGLTSPAAKLDVLQETRISFAQGNQYRTRITNTDGNTRILSDGQQCNIIFGTTGLINNGTASEVMRLNWQGYLGIGTSSPANKIQAKYSPVAIGNLTATNDASSTTNFNVNAGLLIEDSNTSNGLALGVSGQANDRKSWIQSGHPTSLYGANLGTLSINPLGGNVGIGTSSPSTSLSVQGTSSNGINIIGVGTTAVRGFMGLNSSNHGYLFVAGSSGQGPAVITSVGNSYITGGNFGIGTTSPGAKLEVENHTTTTSLADILIDGKRTNGTDGVFGELVFSNNGDSVATIAGFRDTADNKGSLVFQTQDGGNGFGTRMTLASSGLLTVNSGQAVIDRPVGGGNKPYLFWRTGGVNQASIYGASGATGLRFFLEGGQAAFDNSISFTGIVQQNAQSVVLSNSAYSNAAAVQAYATNTANVYPGYGFHKASSLGGFLYAKSRTELRYRGDGGTDKVLLMADSDYEEGTWTPAVAGVVLSTATGRYIKVGNMVCVWGRIVQSSGASTTNAVTGLPFTTNGGSRSPMNFSQIDDCNWGAGATMLVSFIQASEFDVYGNSNGNSLTIVPAGWFGSSSFLEFGGTYIIY